MLYFSGNAHLLKYNICGWLICGEWKLADVVVKEESDILFVSVNSLAQRKAIVYGNYLSSALKGDFELVLSNCVYIHCQPIFQSFP